MNQSILSEYDVGFTNLSGVISKSVTLKSITNFTTNGIRYPPLVTAYVVFTCVLLFYGQGDLDNLKLSRDSILPRPWTTVTYSLLHSDTEHLWNNMIITIMCGSLYEIFRGHLNTTLFIFIAAQLSGLGHVVLKTNRVKGYSGVGFAYVGFLCLFVASFNFEGIRLSRELKVAFFIFKIVVSSFIMSSTLILLPMEGCIEGHAMGALSGILLTIILSHDSSQFVYGAITQSLVLVFTASIPVMTMLYVPETWVYLSTTLAVTLIVLPYFVLHRVNQHVSSIKTRHTLKCRQCIEDLRAEASRNSTESVPTEQVTSIQSH